jgi:hypothetical protein
MKKISLIILCFFSISAFGQSLWDSTYFGNGKTGFGGTLGQGTLKIDFRKDSVYFTFKKGPGLLNDAFVLYLQTDIDRPNPEDPGFSSTANFTDDGDGLRRAISGFSGFGRSVLKFADGFMPSVAIAFNANFAGGYELRENGQHEFMLDLNLRPAGDKNAQEYVFALPYGDNDQIKNSDNPFVGRVKKTTSGTDPFRFLVTYISETGFRSNEFIGDVGPTYNSGFSEYQASSYAIGYAPDKIEDERHYFGNHKDGFGGAIGNGNLTIKVRDDSLFLILRKGNGDFNDIVVIYGQGNVPAHPTGISSTVNFTDFSNSFTKAISGYDGNNRSVLTFANKFKPDMAFVFDKNHASIYELVENGAHNYVGEMSFRIKSYSEYDIDYIVGFKAFDAPNTREELEGFMNTLGLLVNYVRSDGFRSNEFIGDPGPLTNPGWGNYISTTFIGDNNPTPVTLMSFGASYNNNQVNLQWMTSQESNIEKYEILRSADGKIYSKIANVNATNSLLQQTYNYVDLSPLSDINFYKLGIISKDGQVEFSKIVSIKSFTSNSFKAYTASSNRILRIELSNAGSGNLIIELTNSMGQKVFQSQIIPSASNLYSVDLNKSLPVGIYAVSVTRGGEKFSQMIIIK